MMTVDQALRAAEGREEFAVHRYNGLVVLNYLIVLPDSFEGLRREFRGITFSEKTGEIVSLPLHKFFNIGQRPETQWDLLKDKSGEIYEKLDGTMVHFFEHEGQLVGSTRMSCQTTQAREATVLAGRKGLLKLIRYEVTSGRTPIFEFVSPLNQIVVRYEEPRLVYLHSRDRRTGEYSRNKDFTDRAERHTFHFRDILGNLEREEFEGYVAVLEDGTWVKAKCSWYLARHRVVDILMRPAYKLYQCVFDGVMDDVIANAPDARKDSLKKIYTEAQLDLLHHRKRIESLRDALLPSKLLEPREQRKLYAMRCQRDHKEDFSLLMTAYDGKSLDDGIAKRLMEGYTEKYPASLCRAED